MNHDSRTCLSHRVLLTNMKKMIVLLTVVCMGMTLQAATATSYQSTLILYRGTPDQQPLISTSISRVKWYAKLGKISYVFSDDTPIEHLENFNLHTTVWGDPWFPLNGARNNTSQYTITQEGRKLTFTHKDSSLKADPYFAKTESPVIWLSARVKASMPIDARVDVKLEGAPYLDGSINHVANSDPAGSSRIFPHTSRIVGYFRTERLSEDGNDLFGTTIDKFKQFTDIFVVGFRPQHDAITGAVTLTETAENAAGIRRLKALQAQCLAETGHYVNLHLCLMSGTNGPMVAILSNNAKSAILSELLINKMTEYGLDGIDFDYEFPYDPNPPPVGDDALTRAQKNSNYAWYLGGLRRQLYRLDKTLSIANPISWGLPDARVCSNVDWINLMSYDDNIPSNGHHSTYETMRLGLQNHLDYHVPRVKIAMGLPFYTNESKPYNTGGKRVWGNQRGWNDVVSGAISWDRDPDTNVGVYNGQNHSFNSPTMIRAKCDWVQREKLGGVMVWGVDCDVAWENDLCLAKVMSSVIYPRQSFVPPTQNAEGEYRLTSENDLRWFAEAIEGGNSAIHGVVEADITLTRAFPMIKQAFSGLLRGTLDEAGTPACTISFPKGTGICSFYGAALFGNIAGGTVKDLAFWVDSDIRTSSFQGATSSTTGAAVIAASFNHGIISNCHITLTENASVVGNQQAGAIVGGVYSHAAGATALITDCTIDLAGTIQSRHLGTGRVGVAVGNCNYDAPALAPILSNIAVNLRSTARIETQNGTHPTVTGVLGNRNSVNITVTNCTVIQSPSATFTLGGTAQDWPRLGGIVSTAWSGGDANLTNNALIVSPDQKETASYIGATSRYTFTGDFSLDKGVLAIAGASSLHKDLGVPTTGCYLPSLSLLPIATLALTSVYTGNERDYITQGVSTASLNGMSTPSPRLVFQNDAGLYLRTPSLLLEGGDVLNPNVRTFLTPLLTQEETPITAKQASLLYLFNVKSWPVSLNAVAFKITDCVMMEENATVSLTVIPEGVVIGDALKGTIGLLGGTTLESLAPVTTGVTSTQVDNTFILTTPLTNGPFFKANISE